MVKTFPESRDTAAIVFLPEVPYALFDEGKVSSPILQMLRPNLVRFETFRHTRNPQRELLGRDD